MNWCWSSGGIEQAGMKRNPQSIGKHRNKNKKKKAELKGKESYPESANLFPEFKYQKSLHNRAEARRTTILCFCGTKTTLQKDRQDEKAEGYVPDEGTR